MLNKSLVGLSLTAVALFLLFAPAAQAEETQAEAVPLKPGTLWVEPKSGLEFVWMPAGCFDMGASDGELAEQPVHKVCLKGFYISRYEMTQSKYTAVMDNNPASFKGRNFPVDRVSWTDANEVAQELSAASGLKIRLPSEAEWEYACRAGGLHDTYCGAGAQNALAWSADNATGVHAVGDKRENAWGVFDMSGNVREWTQDCWHDNYQGAPKDGSAWLAGACSKRVVRGGSWLSDSRETRATRRTASLINLRLSYLGFRLVWIP